MKNCKYLVIATIVLMLGCTPTFPKKNSENHTPKKTVTYDKIVMPAELNDYKIAFDSLTDFRYLMKFKDTFRSSFFKLQKIFQASKVEIDSKTEIGVRHTSIGDIKIVQNIYQSAIHNSMETIYKIKGNAFFGGHDVVEKIAFISYKKLNCKNYSFYFSIDSESILVYDSTIKLFIHVVDSTFHNSNEKRILGHNIAVLDEFLYPITEFNIDGQSNIIRIHFISQDYYTTYIPQNKMRFDFRELQKILKSKEGLIVDRTCKLPDYSILLPDWYFKPY